MNSRTQVFPAEETRCERIRPGHLLLLFHGPIFQLYCRSVWQTGVSKGSLTGLQLCNPIHSKLWFTVCSETFLSWPALTISAVCAPVALLWGQTGQASLHAQCASVSFGHQRPCHWFIYRLFLEHSWSELTTAHKEYPKRPAFLQIYICHNIQTSKVFYFVSWITFQAVMW